MRFGEFQDLFCAVTILQSIDTLASKHDMSRRKLVALGCEKPCGPDRLRNGPFRVLEGPSLFVSDASNPRLVNQNIVGDNCFASPIAVPAVPGRGCFPPQLPL